MCAAQAVAGFAVGKVVASGLEARSNAAWMIFESAAFGAAERTLMDASPKCSRLPCPFPLESLVVPSAADMRCGLCWITRSANRECYMTGIWREIRYGRNSSPDETEKAT